MSRISKFIRAADRFRGMRSVGHTPHPGPLPVEGRGRRDRRRGLKRATARASARRVPPSPLNGERAGVRGVTNPRHPTAPWFLFLFFLVTAAPAFGQTNRLTLSDTP